MHFVQSLAQAAARDGVPVTLGVECLDVLPQPVEPELGADGEVGACGRLDRQPARGGELDDVRRAVQRLGGGHRARKVGRHASLQQVARASVVGRAFEAAEPARYARGTARARPAAAAPPAARCRGRADDAGSASSSPGAAERPCRASSRTGPSPGCCCRAARSRASARECRKPRAPSSRRAPPSPRPRPCPAACAPRSSGPSD